MKYGSEAEELAMRGPTSCFHCTLNIIVMQDTHAARAESAFLRSGTLHFRTHTNTLAHTHPALLAVNHFPNCRDFCQASVTVQGSEVTTPSTHTPVFICLFVGLCSFISWRLRHTLCLLLSVFHSTFFFPLSPLCSQTCFSDLSPLSLLQDP